MKKYFPFTVLVPNGSTIPGKSDSNLILAASVLVTGLYSGSNDGRREAAMKRFRDCLSILTPEHDHLCGAPIAPRVSSCDNLNTCKGATFCFLMIG